MFRNLRLKLTVLYAGLFCMALLVIGATAYAVVAGNLLHPDVPRGLPAFIPSFDAPAAITKLPSRAEASKARSALRGGSRLAMSRARIT